MENLACKGCGSNSNSDGPLKVCPACGTPNPDHHEPVADPAPVDPPGIGGHFGTKAAAVVSADAPASTAATSAPAAAPAAPAAPAESTAVKVEKNVEIALEDVDAVAALITKSFAGTPIAAIFGMLGPAAGIGAAVLHQHLLHKGFDLSQLQPIDQIGDHA
jgi:hypothetical protein